MLTGNQVFGPMGYIITDYGKVVFGIMEYLMVNGLAKIVKITLKYFNIMYDEKIFRIYKRGKMLVIILVLNQWIQITILI
jgi:hypothetical protein